MERPTTLDDARNVRPATALPGRTNESGADVMTLSTDGRVARRQRNRERVVDTYVDLLREGVVNPSADDVGERAQVTSRSVYRYLHEDPTLKSDVAQRILAPFRIIPPLADFDQPRLSDRIDAMVSFRLDLYRRAAPIMRALHGELGTDPTVVRAIAATHIVLRQHLMNVFARELAQLPPERRTDIFVVHTLLLFESLDDLHEHLAINEATAVLCRQLLAALTSERVSALSSSS